MFGVFGSGAAEPFPMLICLSSGVRHLYSLGLGPLSVNFLFKELLLPQLMVDSF